MPARRPVVPPLAPGLAAPPPRRPRTGRARPRAALPCPPRPRSDQPRAAPPGRAPPRPRSAPRRPTALRPAGPLGFLDHTMNLAVHELNPQKIPISPRELHRTHPSPRPLPAAPQTLTPAAIPMATSRRSLHALLGGGAVADVLLWRRRNVSAAAVAGATAVWFLFERAGYSLPSVMANSLLLLVVILFFWSKSASLLNRPLPPLPKLEVSDAVVEKAADQALVWINRVILILWVVSNVGMIFNFLTLIYIGVMFSLLVPPLYEKYQDHVDEKIGMAHSLFHAAFGTSLVGCCGWSRVSSVNSAYLHQCLGKGVANWLAIQNVSALWCKRKAWTPSP
ncbi:hypothetical protein GUJ93_ZPchr0438g28954 [Zizania palustris]|uniref:Reticulon-like protein n=1 Tax=Zizania palustris TaxID=103762 RepID=A0A8J5VBX1_ZIZPA|nr:hypothetical protein GUJ93_ZPchr0438g28954 [Zizania palustris]